MTVQRIGDIVYMIIISPHKYRQSTVLNKIKEKGPILVTLASC